MNIRGAANKKKSTAVLQFIGFSSVTNECQARKNLHDTTNREIFTQLFSL